MGKYDMCMKMYLQDKRRFADLLNGSCFQGKQVIRAEDLEEASESYVATEEKQSGKPLQKGTEITRDVKMRYRSGMILQVLAVENQSYIDYGMPVRCMGYDAAEYSRQLKERKQERRLLARHKEEHKKELKTTIDEKLSGILRSDRLHPVYTICLYSGEEPWDGPRKLSELMKNEAYAHLSKETWEAIAVMTDNAAMLQKKDKYKTENGEEEEYNMCQALEELIEDNRNEGEIKGSLKKTKIVVRNLLRMGFSVDDICKAAECAPALVEEMQQCFREGEKESKY